MSGTTTVERTARFPPRPETPAQARQLLHEALGACGQEKWRDSAEIALTELVTNVVLHARTDMVLRLRCEQTRLEVTIEDFSATIPSQRQQRLDATTGRGLALVAAVTSEHGVTPTRTGKVVWFRIEHDHQPTEVDFEVTLDLWAEDDSLWTAAEPAGPQVEVVGLPPTLWLAASQHHDAVLRELALYRAARSLATEDLAAAERARAAVRSAVDRALRQASEDGAAPTPLPPGHPTTLRDVAAVVDLALALSEEGTADFAVLQDVLDEGQRLAQGGQLLVQPALPEIVALRDWLCEQVIAIGAGGRPSAWQGADAEHFAQSRDHSARDVDFDTASVVTEDGRAIVVDSHNRILGIGELLAGEIGWDVEDLIGRRVVAIIPPAYREAHTAGFTRHLTTGEAHALRVPVKLPVLCAGASERTYVFFIDADRSRSGQAVYIAHLTPDEG